MELRVRGYRDRRRALTPARLLVVVVVLGLLGWKVGPRLFGHKSVAAPKPAPLAQTPAQPPAPPKPAEPAGRPAALDAAEIKADIADVGPKLGEGIAAFEQLRKEAETELGAGASQAAAKLHDYPFKMQQVGAEIDHVPVRSVAVRQFQTRFTRTLYDASRLMGEVLRAARGGGDVAAKKAELDKVSDVLKTFQADWTAFTKQHL